jgi:uncharacterized cofD-like protein
VTIGGRAGPSLIIQGFQGSGWSVTAIVSTTDSGSSSGIIREQFGIPAPGDIRSVLAVAADPSIALKALTDLLEFRFQPAQDSSLRNMALGNLVLTALTSILGGFDRAVQAVAELLHCWARVLPVPSEPATLCARLVDGAVVRGEAKVRATGKPPVAEVFLDPADVAVADACLQAIHEADLIVLGPGGLYCSVLPGLLPPPMRQAVHSARAKVVYICNTTTQPGQTDGFDIVAHAQVILQHLGEGHLDYVLLNTQVPAAEVIDAYGQDHVHFMPVTGAEIERLRRLGPLPIVGNFVEADWQGKRALHKLDTIRHDPRKVATALQTLIARPETPAASGCEVAGE